MSERAARRGFLAAVTGGLAALVAGLATIPGLTFLLSPWRARAAPPDDELIQVATPDQLKSTRPLRVNVYGPRRDAWTRFERAKLGAAWLVRSPEGRVRAFSAVCPHLGCGIDWSERTETFECPCHGSGFGADGRCLHGPAPRGLDELDVQATASEIRIRYLRFKTAIKAKEPIG